MVDFTVLSHNALILSLAFICVSQGSPVSSIERNMHLRYAESETNSSAIMEEVEMTAIVIIFGFTTVTLWLVVRGQGKLGSFKEVGARIRS